MNVTKEILKKYNDINEFNPKYINKDLLYSLVGMLYLDNVPTLEINNIINYIKDNPYEYVFKTSNFEKALDSLDTLVPHYDTNRDTYQILTDAFDRESTYFIHMNKKDDFIIVKNRLRNEYYQYLREKDII